MPHRGHGADAGQQQVPAAAPACVERGAGAARVAGHAPRGRPLRAAITLSLGAALFALGLLAPSACHDTLPPKFIDFECLEEGRCECRLNTECAFGQACVDGVCVTAAAPDVTPQDTGAPPDAGPDTSSPGDTSAPTPGGFLWPCTLDQECLSTKCVAVDGGERVCTRTCLEDCPEGWHCRGLGRPGGALDFFCLPERDRLCELCTTDRGCPGEGALCLARPGGAWCGRDCAEEACPNGYACADAASVDGAVGRQCVPTSGVCQCTLDDVGAEIPCAVDNEHGRCFGVRLCLEGAELGACDARIPAPEVCDGEDNDCNGFIDDNVPVEPCERTNDHGTCGGDLLCIAGAGQVCTAPVPAAEVCDGLDNNCDGTVDGPFRDAEGRYDQLAHCGACNASCEGSIPFAAEVACDVTGEAARCVVVSCVEGYVLTGDQTCVRPPAQLCRPCTTDQVCGGPADRCLAIDPTDTRSFCARDCAPGNIYGEGCPAGYTCETFAHDGAEVSQCLPDNRACDCSAVNAGQIRPCSVTNPHGTCFGVASCDPDLGWSDCTARTPAAEVCDGLDNDCNGLTDDGLGGAPCLRTNEHGACPGVQICDPEAQSLTCLGPDAAPEVCDGLDNDCNGLTDEPFAINILDESGAVVALKYSLSVDHCGGCGVACRVEPPITAVTCDGEGPEPFCRVTACEPGFYIFDGRACLPLPAGNLCLPCTSDAQCQGPNDRCLDYPGGSRCGRDCGPDSIYAGGCPSGYLCDGGQCRRESGDCACDVTGKTRPCARTNPFGTCAGVERCVASGPGAGWQPCDARVPAAEVCDGVDNDCDGLIDQADPDVDVSGLPGYPACENVSESCAGEWICAAGDEGFAWRCTAPTPSPEVCNGRDDDCDGVVDNGFVDAEGRYITLAHCGGCGIDCEQAITNLRRDGAGVASGAVTCEVVDGAPRCVPQVCEPGYIPFPTEGAARLCLPLAARSCQPCTADAECGPAGDRCVTVGADPGRACAQRCDAAAPYPGCTGALGEVDCCPAGFVCDDRHGAPFCSPLSDSCQCSEANAGVIRVCQAEGNDGTTTCFGTETCAPGPSGFTWSGCDLSANVEVCDGLDNNCNGLTDEGFQIAGVYFTDAHCGQCGRNCALAFSAEVQHVFGVCDPLAAGGPECVIGGCLTDRVGAGAPCGHDGACAAGQICRPTLWQCASPCTADDQCGPGGACLGGACAAPCAGDSECIAAHGDAARCLDGHCAIDYQWVDLDGQPGSGCECPAATSLTLDTPEILPFLPVPGAVYVDRDCDGIDGDLETAIFVSSASPSGDGSLAAPFPTIAEALAAWTPSSTHILVATGIYPERVSLVNGAQVFGGYSLDFARRDIVLFPTVIEGEAPGPGEPIGTVRAVGVDQPTVLAGFTIVGYDATEPGAPSVALYIAESTSALRVVNNEIVGGRGAPGAPGAQGVRGVDGPNGADGLPSRECANASCSNGSESQPGGAAGVNAACPTASGCPGMESDAGEDPQVASAPPPGCSYANGGRQSRYTGNPAYHCKYDLLVGGNMVGPNGQNGSLGGAGGGGAGCTGAAGAIVGDAWVPASGAGGAAGGPGTGGQGGSAGGWVLNQKASSCTLPALGANYGDLGGSGAGGGAGGCGGLAGAPGQSGGASFAVLLIPGASAPDIRDNLIVRGTGGLGGAGGNGGTAGRGGNGGRGGFAAWPAWGAGLGGDGGRGGDGGAGGGGGGGCGGPAWGIAGPGIPAAALGSGNVFAIPDATATGGPGGPGGQSPAAGSAGTAGAAGPSANVVAL